jgi:peptidoglycan/LPS O-acetylase OafA/YrhL
VPLYWHHWELTEDAAVALLFSANIIGFHAISNAFSKPMARCEGVVRWVAGMTFTLYLFHYPLVNCLLAVTHWRPNTATGMLLVSGFVVVSVVVLAEVTERRKSAYRRLFAVLLKNHRGQKNPLVMTSPTEIIAAMDGVAPPS